MQCNPVARQMLSVTITSLSSLTGKEEHCEGLWTEQDKQSQLCFLNDGAMCCALFSGSVYLIIKTQYVRFVVYCLVLKRCDC